MRAAIILAVAVIATACSTTKRVTRSKIDIDVSKINQTGRATIETPKDVKIQRLIVTKSGTNFSFEIGGYSATVSDAAVDSAKAEIALHGYAIANTSQMVQFLWSQYMNAQSGRPTQTQQPPTSFELPRGWKIVPSDDPSTPKLEVE